MAATSREQACKNAKHFSNLRQRVNYPRFQAVRLHVAEHAVDGGRKKVCGIRLGRGVMRRTVPGARRYRAIRLANRSGP